MHDVDVSCICIIGVAVRWRPVNEGGANYIYATNWLIHSARNARHSYKDHLNHEVNGLFYGIINFSYYDMIVVSNIVIATDHIHLNMSHSSHHDINFVQQPMYRCVCGGGVLLIS